MVVLVRTRPYEVHDEQTGAANERTGDIPWLIERMPAGMCLTMSCLTAAATDTGAERRPDPASAAVAEVVLYSPSKPQRLVA